MTQCKTNSLVTGEAFHLQTRKLELSASSHEHGWPGRPVFRDFHVFISYDRACPVFPTGTSISGQENLAIRTIQPGYRDEAEWTFRNKIASSCFVCCISHTVNIPLNCSDKARVAKAMIGEKVIILSFVMFPLFLEFRTRTRSQDLRPFLISETGLKGISHLNSKRKGPCNRASPINWTHARKSFVAYHLHINYPVKNHVH